ncbi:MAG TPA: toast rack family protein [Anaerolineae bacterium]|nr:toast rack family protein [Anaerolineae bacterium]HOR00900.1 toast rack family protein [Anaerolineae bacterium]
MVEQRWRRPGLVGPAILILIGGVLLLGNLGMLRFDWWQLWRLWPVVLILLGLDILARHSRWGSALLAVVLVALLGGLFYMLATGPGPARPLFESMANVTRVACEVNEDLAGAKQVDVSIRMGLGSLRIKALDDSPRLMEGALSYPQGWQAPRVSYSVTGDRGVLSLESRGTHGLVLPFGRVADGESWTVDLSREVPLDIDVEAGASSSVLDLSRLRLGELRVKGGVGRMEILFPSEGRQMTARIDGGVGEIVARIPEGVAARVTVRGGLGSTSFSSRFTSLGGQTYETPGYASAANRLDLYVEGGVGSLHVD